MDSLLEDIIIMMADSDDEELGDPGDSDENLQLVTTHQANINIVPFLDLFEGGPVHGPRQHSRTRLLTLEDLCQFVPKIKFKTHFRFEYEQFEVLKEALQIPNKIHFNNGCCVSGYEALAIFLKRLSSHALNEDLSLMFHRPATTIGALCVEMARRISSKLDNLQSFHHRWLSFQDLSLWAQKISDKEITLKSGRVVKMPLSSVGGFVDGKCIGCCRPCRAQRAFYCMHHATHVFKYMVR